MISRIILSLRKAAASPQNGLAEPTAGGGDSWGVLAFSLARDTTSEEDSIPPELIYEPQTVVL